jgi:aspartate carbamoyltransferase regulatory subunit
MRMALILKLLEEAKNPVRAQIATDDLVYDHICTNPKCICQTEQELRHTAKVTEEGVLRCIYCEQKV